MSLRENIFRDTVSELPIREIVTVKRKTKVRDAVEEMRAKRLGCVIVVDVHGKPVGKFTERKLMKLLLDDPDKLNQPIEKFMYPGADPIKLEDSIARMVQLMRKKGIRFICVVDKKGKAVGLTGQKGLAEYIAEQFPRQIKVQRMKPFLAMQEREGA